MSVAGFNSANTDALASAKAHTIPSIRAGGIVISSQKVVVGALALMIVLGAGLRLKGLGSIGFAEDEINKVEAARAYDRGDFTANAEHPMLMKLLIYVALRGARAWNLLTSQAVSDEAALRVPN